MRASIRCSVWEKKNLQSRNIQVHPQCSSPPLSNRSRRKGQAEKARLKLPERERGRCGRRPRDSERTSRTGWHGSDARFIYGCSANKEFVYRSGFTAGAGESHIAPQ